MPFPNDDLTLSTQISVTEAEDLSGATLSDWDVSSKAALSQDILRPWNNFSFDLPDDYGFFKASSPTNSDIEGYAAGKSGLVPLLLVMAMHNTRCFSPQSGLATLLLAKRLFRWHSAISLEGGALRRAAWHEAVDLTALAPVPRYLWDLRERCAKLGDQMHLNSDIVPIDSTLDYALPAAYPHAGSTVLCCSRGLANYWATGPFPAIATAAHAVIADLLARSRQLAEANGMPVIEGKFLALPGYEPLFDSQDIANF